MAWLGAVIYRFPSRHIKVVAVTGTKGKTSVVEITNAILREAGYKTAVSNTIRFKIAGESRDNMHKMSMPGRFFMQKFLSDAVKAGCQYAVVEATSQGAQFFRHRFIDFDALIFTNIAPEHIEAHGSFDKYLAAKLSIAEAVSRSPKKPTIIVANKDDKHHDRFVDHPFEHKVLFSLSDAAPFQLHKEGFYMTVRGMRIDSLLSGEFNIMNELAAITYADTQGISIETCKKAIEKFTGIRGRVERIEAGQDFTVVVDYAHTPDSLQKLYDVFQNSRRICVLGNTGGGRDTWKRDQMARIAAAECDEIILTNEDPYDDDPKKIVDDMAAAIADAVPQVIMDRREAIAKALAMAKSSDAVLITGKGTDPYIMGANNTKIPWDDATVVREELAKLKQRG
ncbi:MAG: UDP-N-acetylmuramyl-tripeptide synthetase [bacterium]|nr:UDP-N-acetylmuramyl-tripeptide synthetase [bacterium]